MFSTKKRELELELNEIARTHFRDYINDPISQLLQEARSCLLIGLSQYKHLEYEKGDKSKYLYPSYPSGRITRISDIAGCFQNDNQFISLWHLINYAEQINTTNLANIIFELAALQRKDCPPLKKGIMTQIQHAIILILNAMKQGNHFPTPVMDGVHIFIAVAKTINTEKLPHVLMQHQELIKDIHDKKIAKEFLQKESPFLLKVVECTYARLSSHSTKIMKP